MSQDQSQLADYSARAIDVSAPPMGRYASQLLLGLAREFSGGQAFGRFSMISEIGTQLEKRNGKPPADSTITRVAKAAFGELLTLGLCVPASSSTWTLSELGEISALALRTERAESDAIDSLESDIAKLEADLAPKARKARSSDRAALAQLEARIARLEAERAETERAARAETERAERAALAQLEAARAETERAARAALAQLEAERAETERAALAQLEAERARAASFLARAARASACCAYSLIPTGDGRTIHARDCQRARRESAA